MRLCGRKERAKLLSPSALGTIPSLCGTRLLGKLEQVHALDLQTLLSMSVHQEEPSEPHAPVSTMICVLDSCEEQ